MTPPHPQKPRPTIMGAITQAVQTVQAKVNFSKLALKPNARVPELRVQDADADQAEVYPLLGDRYKLGRSSKSCDIVVRNPVVSQIHLSLTRVGRRQKTFLIKDENSTNGIYRGRKRVSSRKLRHGDILTLGPKELAGGVRIQYYDPPTWYEKAINWGIYGITGLTALLAITVLLEWQKFSVHPLPNPTRGPVIVYAGDETPLRTPRNNAHVEFKKLSDFSPYLPKAVVASEDRRFYWHLGVDPIGIARASFIISKGGDRQGGSTVTQQVARSLFRDYVGSADSLGRKLREAIVALKLETFYSKNDILLTYLNRVFLGGDSYGFEDASQYYFGKSARDISLAEAATLVSNLPAPNSFNPCGDSQARERAITLRNGVIARMLEQGKITVEEASKARRSPLEVNPKVCQEQASKISPYFYSYVFNELEFLLGEELAREGNFIIETALNLGMQAKAESALRNTVNNAGANSRFSQGAIVTLDSNTGAILTMVGGLDYKQSQFNRVTQAHRQAASTFKVFTYAAALDKGISPNKSYSCAPLVWQKRYPGCERTGGGSANMYNGIAQSENVIALRVAQDVGLDNVVQMAQRMGIQSKLNPVPGLVLGQSEVYPLEMTGAFGAIANNGVWNRPHAIVRIRDTSFCRDIKDLKTCPEIYSFTPDKNANSQRVLRREVADRMNTLLRGVVQFGTGRNASLGLGEEAGKTGTNSDNRDLWFIGYVPSQKLVTGVWLGNDDNSPTRGASAQAALLWGNYMRQVIR
ncbi:transglycosylase domain-containing protein [Phormidium sp. LEGE 05292]|uniref:transglycosylase domain-containing protein n=1 Tax=[Phormidium] sp. LEGE 05292 TaxID=767427 RepID=UPI0018809E38|nr:transglycosylase domain-containing protein [Phormidium sp. LEGE 05292]MBE9226705.1 transglycosylase domain-containing protein [Phormidium sp. LEGE 05292]